MKRKIFSLIAALCAAILITSTVFAGAIKLSSSFRLGSLIAEGVATGLGGTDWLLELSASGRASVICTNFGGNDVPGQSYPHVDSNGTVTLDGDSQFRKNGKSPFTVTAKPGEELSPVISSEAGSCPNRNWNARIDFVYWEKATILVKDPVTEAVVATYNYTCTTTRIPQNDGYTFDDGTISCSQIK
jgi:hypothetical protein